MKKEKNKTSDENYIIFSVRHCYIVMIATFGANSFSFSLLLEYI